MQTTLDTDLFVFGSKLFDKAQVDVLISELVTGPRFRVASEGSGSTLVRPFMVGNVTHLGYDVLYASFGGHAVISIVRSPSQPPYPWSPSVRIQT
ncbi:MAG: hypothetical protein OXE44_12665 [Nitrospinae bacterium]|nr:hypothetical protein [Nitrospinota bacterium]